MTNKHSVSIVLLKWFLLLSLGHSLSSCAYRFTNVAMSPPKGINSIAVEGIYDTSREVIPHEILWTSLMEEFGRNGRLMVTSKENADALVRVQLKEASVFPSGAQNAEPIYKDPVVTADNKRTPGEFKNLRRAGNWTTSETLTYNIVVEVHNLKTREKIFERTYSTGGVFRSFRDSTVAQPTTGFLLYEEALEARMKSISASLARKVVTDILL